MCLTGEQVIINWSVDPNYPLDLLDYVDRAIYCT